MCVLCSLALPCPLCGSGGSVCALCPVNSGVRCAAFPFFFFLLLSPVCVCALPNNPQISWETGTHTHTPRLTRGQPGGLVVAGPECGWEGFGHAQFKPGLVAWQRDRGEFEAISRA